MILDNDERHAACEFPALCLFLPTQDKKCANYILRRIARGAARAQQSEDGCSNGSHCGPEPLSGKWVINAECASIVILEIFQHIVVCIRCN